MTPTDSRTFELLLAATDDELLAELGASLAPRSAFPKPRKALIELAVGWLAANSSRLAEAICRTERIRDLASQDPQAHERAVLAAAVSDVLLHECSGLPVATIAVLVVRQGLHAMCARHWH